MGEVILVKGKVTDPFGVPISGAIIEIWQTNSAGKYQNLLEKNSNLIDSHFNMSGKAITDNLGNYHFLTIMPGFYLNRAPHININIYHKDFDKIETEMYFEDHPSNLEDYEYLSYSDRDKELLTANVRLSNIFYKNSEKICIFNIVMNGIHKYKNYGGNN
jgi:protocatechuate 3,4-dioxygenase beta subunit